MNIVLIAGNFLQKKGGISTTLLNFYDKLSDLGEKIYIFNGYQNRQFVSKLTHSKEKFYIIFFQKISFYIFLFKLFIRILFFKGLKYTVKFKIAFYYCLYPKDLVNRIKSIKNYISYFKNLKIDIIFCASSSYPLLYGFILSKMFRVPLVTLAHGEDFIKRYPYKINTIIFQSIEKIIFSNKIMKQLFQKIHNVKEEKFEIIFRGVNLEKTNIKKSKEELRESLNIPKNDFIILTISRFHPRKGIDTVINALKLILDQYPHLIIKYFIIGDGKDQQRLKRLVSELNMNNIVKFLGNVDDSTRNNYYKLSDLFILVPKLKKGSIEGFGIVYIEANSFKLPVIGSYTGGIKEAVINGKTGFLVKPNNEVELKEKIILIYNDDNLRSELGNYGYQRVINFYNWNKIAQDYQKTLKEYYNVKDGQFDNIISKNLFKSD